jgi:glycerol kinase
MCEQLRERGLIEKIRRRTGLVIDPYFSATKLAWLLDNVDGVRDAAQSGHILFGTIDTWILWKLTDGRVHATDYTNASRTMLFDIHSLTWDEVLLEELDIPAVMLPEVFPSSGVLGMVNCGNSTLDGVPITGDAGDQQAALFGQACFHPGSIKNTYGTGCFLMLNTGRDSVLSEHGLLTTIACGADGSHVYALEGSIFNTGAAVQWLRDGLKLITNASETESLAESVPDTGGVYVVPAFTGLGAPYWDADARGAILGITRGTQREHIVRATLESIAYQTADVMEAMRSDSGQEIEQLRVDGGAVANDFLMQFQSDVLGIEVNRPVINETTALGAAFLAGLAVGFWEDESQLEKCRETDAIFRSTINPERRQELLKGWQEAVQKTTYKG